MLKKKSSLMKPSHQPKLDTHQRPLHMIMSSQHLALLAQRLGLTLLDLRKSCLLSCLPLQPMYMFPSLPHCIPRHKQGPICIPLRCFRIHQTLFRSHNTRVARAAAAAEHARRAFRRAGTMMCSCCATGGAAAVTGVAVGRRGGTAAREHGVFLSRGRGRRG